MLFVILASLKRQACALRAKALAFWGEQKTRVSPRSRVSCKQNGQRLVSWRNNIETPHVVPEGTNHSTSVNVQLLCLQKDLRTCSISRDMVTFPPELCRRRSDMFMEVARLVPPHVVIGNLLSAVVPVAPWFVGLSLSLSLSKYVTY